MANPLRVLMVEDEPADAELIAAELRQAGYELDWQRVESEAEYVSYLEADFDVILADYHLPQWDGLRALRLMQDRGLDIPFIIVTGTLGDELAAECVRKGASDYLLKDRLARLGTAVEEALALKQLREQERLLRQDLEQRNGELEQRVREITALNQLFQEHLEQRFEVVDAYRKLLQELETSPQNLGSILQRAREHPLPDLEDVPGLGLDQGGVHPEG